MDGYEDYVWWLNWSKEPPLLEEVEADCRQHHAEFILRESIRYIILDKNTGRVLGRAAFPPLLVNWSIPQFGISYFIRKSERSKGYATETTHALISLAFKVLKAKKVEIYCDRENLISKRIPIKLGMKLEYTQKGGWLRADGELAELETYALFSLTDLPIRAIKW